MKENKSSSTNKSVNMNNDNSNDNNQNKEILKSERNINNQINNDMLSEVKQKRSNLNDMTTTTNENLYNELLESRRFPVTPKENYDYNNTENNLISIKQEALDNINYYIKKEKEDIVNYSNNEKEGEEFKDNQHNKIDNMNKLTFNNFNSNNNSYLRESVSNSKNMNSEGTNDINNKENNNNNNVKNKFQTLRYSTASKESRITATNKNRSDRNNNFLTESNKVSNMRERLSNLTSDLNNDLNFNYFTEKRTSASNEKNKNANNKLIANTNQSNNSGINNINTVKINIDSTTVKVNTDVNYTNENSFHRNCKIENIDTTPRKSKLSKSPCSSDLNFNYKNNNKEEFIINNKDRLQDISGYKKEMITEDRYTKDNKSEYINNHYNQNNPNNLYNELENNWNLINNRVKENNDKIYRNDENENDNSYNSIHKSYNRDYNDVYEYLNINSNDMNIGDNISFISEKLNNLQDLLNKPFDEGYPINSYNDSSNYRNKSRSKSIDRLSRFDAFNNDESKPSILNYYKHLNNNSLSAKDDKSIYPSNNNNINFNKNKEIADKNKDDNTTNKKSFLKSREELENLIKEKNKHRNNNNSNNNNNKSKEPRNSKSKETDKNNMNIMNNTMQTNSVLLKVKEVYENINNDYLERHGKLNNTNTTNNQNEQESLKTFQREFHSLLVKFTPNSFGQKYGLENNNNNTSLNYNNTNTNDSNYLAFNKETVASANTFPTNYNNCNIKNNNSSFRSAFKYNSNDIMSRIKENTSIIKSSYAKPPNPITTNYYNPFTNKEPTVINYSPVSIVFNNKQAKSPRKIQNYTSNNNMFINTSKLNLQNLIDTRTMTNKNSYNNNTNNAINSNIKRGQSQVKFSTNEVNDYLDHKNNNNLNKFLNIKSNSNDKNCNYNTNNNSNFTSNSNKFNIQDQSMLYNDTYSNINNNSNDYNNNEISSKCFVSETLSARNASNNKNNKSILAINNKYNVLNKNDFEDVKVKHCENKLNSILKSNRSSCNINS